MREYSLGDGSGERQWVNTISTLSRISRQLTLRMQALRSSITVGLGAVDAVDVLGYYIEDAIA